MNVLHKDTKKARLQSQAFTRQSLKDDPTLKIDYGKKKKVVWENVIEGKRERGKERI